MPSLQTILLFMGAGLALNLTPGPDMLYVAARGSSEGRAAGVASALGIFVGCLLHIAALALGLSAVLARVPAAFDAIRLLGAAYLIYLGVRSLARPASLAGALSPVARSAVFLQGVWTNVLNPKVALFFLALLPQFIEPNRGPAATQVVLLGMLFNTTGFIVNGVVGVLASVATDWLRRQSGPAIALQRLTAILFIGLGIRLVFGPSRLALK
jgi:threonine/homoserine/homoserine lactone efflux protein